MKSEILTIARLVLISTLVLSLASSASAKGKEGGEYKTGFVRWRAAEAEPEANFNNWTLSGVKLNANGALEFDAATASASTDPYATGSFSGRNYYNGGSFLVGEATSREITTPFNYTEAIASWN